MKTSFISRDIENAVSFEVAQSSGYSPITECYKPNEWRMMEGAIRSLKDGGRKFLLVARAEGHEIWIPKVERRR